MGRKTAAMPRILVVDRSATFRHTLCQALQQGNFEVDSAASPAQAARKLRAEGLAFSAVVMGWPRFRNDAQTLADTLCLEELAHLGLVVFSDDPDLPDKRLLKRVGSTLLTWSQHKSICEMVRASVTTAKEANRETSSDRAVAILLVDDSSTVRLRYSQLLCKHRYHVEVAGNVNEGMQKALASHFDIAVIDYFMPDATGDELCRRLREHPTTRHMTTSVLTGAYRDEIIRSSLAAGAAECMFKNESEALFLARVAAMARQVVQHRLVETDRLHLQSILDSVADGVYGVDPLGHLTYMNPAARSLLEIGDRDITGMRPFELFHHSSEDGQRLIAETCFLTQAYANGEAMSEWRTVFWTPDGRSIPVEGSVVPLHEPGQRQGSVVAFRDVAEQKLMEDELRWQAQHDPLTGLLNRHSFDQDLEQECRTLKRSGRSSALAFIDLDRFKQINDVAGHEAGDHLLAEVGKRLSSRLRGTDTLARLGGDEFGLILRNVDPQQVLAVADTFRNVLAELTFAHGGKNFDVNGSVGVTLLNDDTLSATEALTQADQAANIAKSKGRNQTYLFQAGDAGDSGLAPDIGWSARISRALEQDTLLLEFQPVFRVADNTDEAHRIVAYEALLRMSNVDGPVILPGAFLPPAERFGLMQQLDRWVCKRSIEVLAQNPELPFSIAVNLSLDAVGDERLPQDIETWLVENSVDAGRLQFEISQNSINTDSDGVLAFMNRLCTLGCRFALDDFGGGVTSLTQVKKIPVDTVKIDGQLVQAATTDAVDRAVVKSLCRIARACGKLSAAKFVESAQSLAIVRECGVDLVQGFYICRPLPTVAESQADLLQGNVHSALSIS